MNDPSAPPTSGDTSFSQGILLLTIIPTTASATVGGLRFATRAWITKNLGWDDYTMMFAVFGTLIGMALDFVEVHYGYGRHKYYLTPHQLQEFLKYTWGEWIQTFATLINGSFARYKLPCTGACCIVRTVLNGGAIPEDDVSYGGLTNWIWRAFEVNLGIIAASIPALRPGYKWLLERLSSSRKASSVHLPLADRTTAVPPRAYTTKESALGLSDSDILKTTTLDVEAGYFR
ncbi:MAG: hypothetical protein LQ338_001499 [Usnochroma carphineum]|nr:MAG: hypothetical protein LQ338_001499 [Usnochroma carphineum]